MYLEKNVTKAQVPTVCGKGDGLVGALSLSSLLIFFN